jgi:hypothetical protein
MMFSEIADDGDFHQGVYQQLRLYLDALVEPKKALATIASTEGGRTGVAVSAYLLAIGVAALLQQPAADHITALTIEVKAANASPDVAAMLHHAVEPSSPFLTVASSAAGGIVSLLLSALYYFAVGALGGRVRSFGKAWCLAANSSIIVAVTALINSAIVCLRGTASATSLGSLFAVPGLGDFFAIQTFAIALSVYNVINIYYYVEAVAGLEIIFGVRRGWAIASVLLLSVLTSGYYFIVATIYTKIV